MKDAETIAARVSRSVERREETLIDMDETIYLAKEMFLVKTIRFDVILKIVKPSGTSSYFHMQLATIEFSFLR